MDITTITLRMLLERPLDIPIAQWALFALIVTIVTILIYVHCKKDSLDLRWLILDQHRKPSLVKIAQLVTLIVSTWGFVILTLKGQLTETYFIFFMIAWSGSAALEAYMNRGQRDSRRSSDPDTYRYGAPDSPNAGGADDRSK